MLTTGLLARAVRRAATSSGLAAAARRSMATEASEKPLEKTALHDLHVQLGGKMVPFAGYSLPVQYPEGVLKSHLHTRAADSASLFDVGHMGQIIWKGKDRVKFLESLVVADVAEMKAGESKLTLVTTAKGGILDDSVFTVYADHIYMVVNGATKYGDMAHFDAQLAAFKAANPGAEVSYDYLHTQNLVALQGQGAAAVLGRLANSGADKDALGSMKFMSGTYTKLMGDMPVTVTRCGYTGEDGYEISVRPEHAVKLASALLEHKEVLAAGLGARDSLRLEAGLCLYGHDIDESTTPGEASLIWTIGKRRRAEGGGFLGSAAILGQIKDKSWARKRVGLAVQGAPAREGTKIYTRAPGGSTDPAAARQIGVVTSGTFSPCLKAPVAMGYVETASAGNGSEVAVEVRGKLVPAVVSPMPFVPTRYFKGTGGK